MRRRSLAAARLRQAGLVAIALGATAAAPARADAVVDRAAVRFFAPETGGADHPRFVLERTLAFEARLEAMGDGAAGLGEGARDRDLRNALDHDVAEQVLATLAQKLIDDSPADKRPPQSEIDAVSRRMATALVERLGGRPRIDAAAAAEQVDPTEVDALLVRGGLAAWYLDRSVTPILHPSEEQLRDVFRTAAHPYRGRPFDEVRDALERWFVLDRVRVAEAAFLQAARSHVKLVVTRAA
jgi:hypothetical protein